MKTNLKAVLLLGVATSFGLNPSLSFAGEGFPNDAGTSFRGLAPESEGLNLSLAMDFGAAAAKACGIDFTLRYGNNHPEAGRWMTPALFSARREAGQWQSLKLSGVDVLNLKQRLQAQGEDTHYAGWIIGGLVGVGVIAIVVREATNDKQKSFDINGANSDAH